jgi:hypothetical protein
VQPPRPQMRRPRSAPKIIDPASVTDESDRLARALLQAVTLATHGKAAAPNCCVSGAECSAAITALSQAGPNGDPPFSCTRIRTLRTVAPGLFFSITDRGLVRVM